MRHHKQATSNVVNWTARCGFRIHWLDPRGGEHSREASLARQKSVHVGDLNRGSKLGKYQHYNRQNSKPRPEQERPETE